MTGAAHGIRERLRPLEGTGMRTFATPEPMVWERTSGTAIWDADGREYLDLYAGFAAATVGYCHPRVTEAIVAQAGRMTHCPSAAPSEVRAAFYERLLALAPPGLERVLLATSGSQANEMAIQLARAATGRSGVIAFSGTYIGRSAGAVRYAGKRAYRTPLGVATDGQFLPFPDPYRAPWAAGGDPGAVVLGLLAELIDDPASGIDEPACIVVEPIQGNGGVVIPPSGFLAGLRRLADRAGALLVFDEIQCGFGRSGRDWACDHEGVVPDLMTVGKGIGGGLPLAAVLGREAPMTTWAPDAVTATFVANALPLAAGVAALDVYREERLSERSARLGATLIDRLRLCLADVATIGDVRGRGLFVGLEVVRPGEERAPDPQQAAALVGRLLDRGVIVGRGGHHGNVLKVSPALVIDEDVLDRGIDGLLEVLACP